MTFRLLVMLFFIPLFAVAQQDPLAALSNPSTSPLSSDQAFSPSIQQKDDSVLVRFYVASGYKLYRDKIDFDATGAKLGRWELPKGIWYNDPEFGRVRVFPETFEFELPIIEAEPSSKITLHYQGCSDGLCYPPQETEFQLKGVSSADDGEIVQSSTVEISTQVSDEKSSDAQPKEGLWQYVIFFMLGIGLGFTPCVFPMYPIMSAVVLSGATGVKKTASLSFSYVQGMAVIYSLVGVIVALVGVQIQSALQSPWVISGVALLFVILAGSLFGFYTLQLPSGYQSRITQVSQKQAGGTTVKAFLMGTVSGLVASPCTTAPLAGILMFIAQTGDVVNGFVSLYSLSLGMGVPLMVFAVTGGKLLPRSGEWMNVIKHLLGFSMLAVSVYFLSRVVSTDWVLRGTSVLLFALSCYVHYVSRTSSRAAVSSFSWGVAVVSILLSVFLFARSYGFFSTAPSLDRAQETSSESLFVEVNNEQEWEGLLEDAQEKKNWVMLDFYADWCSACLQYERNTFSSKAVREALSGVTVVKVDASQNNPFVESMQKRYQVVGMPSILWFSPEGDAEPTDRITGYLQADEFIERTQKIIH